MTIKVTYNVTDVYMTQSVSPVYINVSYSDGTGGAAVWGGITGTLSNQTDLQTALDAKLDESTIDGGSEGQILVKNSATNFDFAWINNYAKYLATTVRNQTGSTIAAFQVVYISGATGNKPLISLADADTEATSSKTYGVTAASIANNGTGDVVTAGELSGIDTSAFTEGDSLWLSTTAGGVVTTPPAEPAHSVFIGTVIRSHPTLGVIDVAIANGYELNELHGVLITSAANNQGLFYDGSLWVNKSIATALGYTPANAATTLTINGVTYDLSANRSWTISAGISGTIASGQVAYGTAANTIGGSNNLFWDNTNGRLGIGTNAPLTPFHVVATDATLLLRNTSSTGYSGINMLDDTNTLTGSFQIGGSGTGAFAGHMFIGARKASGNLLFVRGASATISGVLFSSGNWALGSSTTDDGVNRLQVSGNALIKGSGNTSATTALTVQNSSSTDILRVQNDGATIFSQGSYFLTDTNLIADRTTTDGISMRFRIGSGTNVGGLIITHGGSHTKTSGTSKALSIEHNFAPTSGTAQFTGVNFAPIINQTGGANGITRGLYVNPTLTSAADFRAIETARGNIVFSNLPTSATGLPSGAIWNDAGTLKIV